MSTAQRNRAAVSPPPPPTRLCPCKIFDTVLIPCRLLGRFPYTWTHTATGQCHYTMSTSWTIYTWAVIGMWALLSILMLPSFKMDVKNLPVFLDSLTNMLCMIFVGVAAMHLINMKLWSCVMDRFVKLDRTYWFCNGCRKIVKRFYRNLLLIIGFIFLTQNFLYVYLKWVMQAEMPFHVLFFRNQLVMPFSGYYLCFACFRYFSGMFTCFENVVCNYLDYKPIHPHKDMQFTHNRYQFLGFTSAEERICDERHSMPPHLHRIPKPKIIEHLRILHEEMYESVTIFQNFCSPQLLAYIVLEIVILIVTAYSIVVHLVYKFDNVTAGSTFALNCTYFVWHGVGVFWFVRNAHDCKKVMQGLRNILMSLMLVARDHEEKQQLRIFIHKIEYQRPFVVNDFFVFDLSILGPIVGNVFTYVLVALQFKIPAQEQ